jgi:phosphatidate cytidylyltransferase
VLIQRLATAAVGIPLIVLTIWVGGALLAAVVAIAVVIASIELATARGMQTAPMSLLAAAVTAVLPLAALAGQEYVLGAAIGAVVLISTGYTMRPDPREDIEGWLWGVSTAIYLGALDSYFVLLRRGDNGRDWLFFTVITVWVTDTGAYFVGRTF